MKLYKRVLSVLLVCLLLFVPFSTAVHAESDYDLNSLYYRVSLADTNYSYIQSVATVRNLNQVTHWRSPDNTTIAIEFPQYLMFEYTPSSTGFNTATSTIIVPEGDGFSLSVDNIYDTVTFLDSEGNIISQRERTKWSPTIKVELFDISGKYQSFTPDDLTSSIQNGRISFTVDINEVPYDVYRFRVVCYESSFPFGGTRPTTYSSYHRRVSFDSYSSHSVKNIPEEKGLLKSIIEWLKSIGGGITNVFNSIVELPGKLWTAIENGLKTLFVPSDDYLSQYSESWDELLSSRFGALYQVGGLIIDFGEDILSVLNEDNETSYIDFPEVDIPIGGGNTFTFGGWRVKLTVDGFSVLYDAIWLISAALGTFIFINGLRRRYEDIMEVN